MIFRQNPPPFPQKTAAGTPDKPVTVTDTEPEESVIPEPASETMPKPKVINGESLIVKEPPEPQKVVVETKPQKIVVEDRKRGIGCSCRMISCGGCLVFLAAIVAIGYILVTKPPAIVDPVKTWLNQDLQPAPGNGTTEAAALSDLGNQASSFKVGDNDLVITQDQLLAILQTKVTTTGLNLVIVPNGIKIFVNGDSASKVPLWIVAEVGTDDGQNLKLTKLGTERIALPTFMNEFLTRVVFSVANLVTKSNADASNLLSAVFPLPSNVKLKSVTMDTGKLTLKLTLSSGLESLFGQ